MITKITGKLLRLDDDSATLGIDAVRVPGVHPRIDAAGSLQPLVGQRDQPAHDPLPRRRSVARPRHAAAGRLSVRGRARVLRDVLLGRWRRGEEGAAGDGPPGAGHRRDDRRAGRQGAVVAARRRRGDWPSGSSPSCGARCPSSPCWSPASKTYEADVKRDVVEETFEALRTLGHSDADARKLLDGVLKTKRKFTDVEAVLQAIYQQSHGHAGRRELIGYCVGKLAGASFRWLCMLRFSMPRDCMCRARVARLASRLVGSGASPAACTIADSVRAAPFDVRHVPHAAVGQHRCRRRAYVRAAARIPRTKRRASRDWPVRRIGIERHLESTPWLLRPDLARQRRTPGCSRRRLRSRSWKWASASRAGPDARARGPDCCDTAGSPARAASPSVRALSALVSCPCRK